MFAVPYRGARRLTAIRLPDDVILETPTPAQLAAGPCSFRSSLRTDDGDVLPSAGVFVLPDGRLAAVYGAVDSPPDSSRKRDSSRKGVPIEEPEPALAM